MRCELRKKETKTNRKTKPKRGFEFLTDLNVTKGAQLRENAIEMMKIFE
jgi:hypothetical protein